jgi:hypothetical protein
MIIHDKNAHTIRPEPISPVAPSLQVAAGPTQTPIGHATLATLRYAAFRQVRYLPVNAPLVEKPNAKR